MILLDASGLIALIAGEPAAPDVKKLLRAGKASISAINLAEAMDVLERVTSVPAAKLDMFVDTLLAAGLAVVPMTEAHAKRAARLRARHYQRRWTAVSVADCVLVAAALELQAGVATADRALGEVAREEGLVVHQLRDSAGRLAQS